MKKSLLAVFFALLMVMGFATIVSAQDVADIDAYAAQPRYSYIRSIAVSPSVDIITGKLAADIVIKTYEKCDMTAQTVLYQKSGSKWNPIKTWNSPASGGVYTGTTWAYTNYTYVDPDGTYKIETTATVTSVEDGNTESGTATMSNFTAN